MATPFCNLRWLTAEALFLGFALVVSTTAASAQTASPIHVSSEAALAATPSKYAIAVRDGYYVAGDSPSLPYTASSAVCSLNSGTGDKGSQVPSSDGGCWLANFAGIQPDPTIWGAVPAAGFFASASGGTTLTVSAVTTGKVIPGVALFGPGITGSPTIVSQLTGPTGGAGTYQLSASETAASVLMYSGADASAAVQAAITAIATRGGALYSGPHMFLMAAGVSSPSNGQIDLEGCRSKLTCGFATIATNLNLITLSGNNNSTVRGLYLDNHTPGLSGSGAMISILGGGNNLTQDNFFEQPCTAVDVEGPGVRNYSDHDFINDAAGSACEAIVEGKTTIDGAGGATNSDPLIDHDTIGPKFGNPVGVAIAIYEAGGIHVLRNTVLQTIIGTKLEPGANQTVQAGWFVGELGDTSSNIGLDIAPTNAGGTNENLVFSEAWSANSTNENLVIGGVGANTSFMFTAGTRFPGGGLDSVQITKGTDIHFDEVMVCGASETTAATYYEFEIATGLTDLSITNSVIGDRCQGLSGSAGSAAAIHFDGATTVTTIQNNDLSSMANPTPPAISGTLPSDMPFVSRICGNKPYLVPWSLKWNGGCEPQGTVSIANSVTDTLPVGTGLITLTDGTNGDVGVFAVGGGNAVLISSGAGSTFMSGSPSSGKIGVVYSGGNYGVDNNTGSTVVVGAGILGPPHNSN